MLQHQFEKREEWEKFCIICKLGEGELEDECPGPSINYSNIGVTPTSVLFVLCRESDGAYAIVGKLTPTSPHILGCTHMISKATIFRLYVDDDGLFKVDPQPPRSFLERRGGWTPIAVNLNAVK